MFFISISLVNDLSKSYWRNSLSSYEQFCCNIWVENGGYCLFQARSLTLQSDPPGQHEHWPFLPDLHRKMWWKEFLSHIDQALIGSSKFGHVGVFVTTFRNITFNKSPNTTTWWIAMTSCKEYPFSIHIEILLMTQTNICDSYIIHRSRERYRTSYPQWEGFR